MSSKNNLLGTQFSVLLMFTALSFCSAFLLFLFIAAPLVGEQRLAQNAGLIAARFFPIAAGLVLLFTALGVLWLALGARKQIYRPLRQLTKAASQIRDGNLSYELPLGGRGDFYEVALAFEAMRLHLKDTTLASERADAERQNMIANITHDLRTPVTSILGYSEGILDGVAASPERMREYAGIIRRKALALKELVEDLGLLSVLETAPPLRLEPLDVGNWLGAYVHEISLELDAEVEYRGCEQLFCAVERNKLERVMSNLVSNAVKYAAPPDGRRLTLLFTAERTRDAAVLSVSDNGPGLRGDDLRQVFDRFYRADPSRGRVGGSGLGLAIARQIITLHKGKIWLNNRPEGGLTASLSLPLTDPAGGPAGRPL